MGGKSRRVTPPPVKTAPASVAAPKATVTKDRQGGRYGGRTLMTGSENQDDDTQLGRVKYSKIKKKFRDEKMRQDTNPVSRRMGKMRSY